jgi:hypothetical protein
MKFYLCVSLCLYYVLGDGCDRQKTEAGKYRILVIIVHGMNNITFTELYVSQL